MRMVKSLLLGGAAGLVAVVGAQAADLPMKAKAPAVQYVKICSLYGAGFYYIPGTDTCLKIGGYIRTQAEWNAGNGGVATGSGAGMNGQGRTNRVDTNDVNYRVRAVVTFDARTQGEYGTLRSYYRVGWASQSPGGSAAGTTAQQAYWDRAFIQFAGFTVGKAQSFFDIYSYGGSRSYLNVRTSGDNGAAGLMLWAYTAQFGNGFSATLSLEDPRGHNLFGVLDISSNAFAPGAGFTSPTDNGLANNAGAGFQVPDIVGNLRIDQPWGFFGVSGALHQVAGGYFQNNGTVGCAAFGPNTTPCGHPEDKWGYAFGVGAQLNVPGMPGDTVGAGFVWSQGAVGYPLGAGTNSWLMVSGNTAGVAWGYDAIFANPGGPNGGTLHLTEAWSINGHYEHLWSRSLKTSVYGGYANVKYPTGAKNLICGGPCAPGISPDYGFWQVGSRTQWSPWAGQLNIGVDVVYTALDTARPFSPIGVGAPQTPKVIADQDIISVMFRVQRNWYP
jgi:Porin subfamily